MPPHRFSAKMYMLDNRVDLQRRRRQRLQQPFKIPLIVTSIQRLTQIFVRYAIHCPHLHRAIKRKIVIRAEIQCNNFLMPWWILFNPLTQHKPHNNRALVTIKLVSFYQFKQPIPSMPHISMSKLHVATILEFKQIDDSIKTLGCININGKSVLSQENLRKTMIIFIFNLCIPDIYSFDLWYIHIGFPFARNFYFYLIIQI